jgi:hypothetical protein
VRRSAPQARGFARETCASGDKAALGDDREAGSVGSHAQEGNEARRGDARGVMVMVRVESGATEEAGEGGLAKNPVFFFFGLYSGFDDLVLMTSEN